LRSVRYLMQLGAFQAPAPRTAQTSSAGTAPGNYGEI
jgi:hypothetical protein